MALTLDQLCELANDTLRIYNGFIGSPLNQKWVNLTEPERQIIRDHITFIKAGNLNAEIAHNHEIYLQALAGWRYDPVYNANQKKIQKCCLMRI